MHVTHQVLQKAITNTINDENFWDVMLNKSLAKSGPFDGGCLICAKAIILAFEGAELIRIVSGLDSKQTEHYGVLMDDVIYDMDGAVESKSGWVKRFSTNENINHKWLSASYGFDATSEIIDDAATSKLIRQILINNSK